jgi:5-methyltetrahydropteroyltriglutamate--homocysteine methyltransferase
MFDQIPSYLPGLELLNAVDADVITFETRASGPGELEAIGKAIAEKKIGIGMIDHHTLQVESPAEVADLARLALEHIPADRLVLTSDCGMGREGMPRRHAFYKMVSLVLGANIVREEVGAPTAEVLAAAPEYSLIRTS